MISIKATDRLGNVAYIEGSPGERWRCTLSNGVPAGLSLAGVVGDEHGVKIKLRNAKNAGDALCIVEAFGRPTTKYEVVDCGSTLPAAQQADPDMLAALEAFEQEFRADIEGGEPINGSDTVDAICRLWPMVRGALAKARGE